MKFVKIISILFILPATFLFGQFGFSVDAQGGYASNIFSNYQQLPDYYQNLQGYLNYDVVSEKQGARIFYQGSATLFEKYDYRSYSLHQAGLSYFNYLTGTTNKLSAGLDFSTRLHTDDYKWYEFKQAYMFANIKLSILPQLLGYLGTNFRVRTYDQLQPFSYWQNVSFLRVSKFLNSGTSLIGEFDVMQKVYLEKDAAPVESFSDLQTDGDGTSRQIVGLVRIGQSVSPKTGLSAQFLFRKNQKSSVRYLVNNDGYYYSDEELFDDPFGYEAEQFDVTLKQKLPWKMQISLGSYYVLKHYSNRLALDLAGYPFEDVRLRDDKRLVNWISLSKTWKYNTNILPLNFSIDVSHIKNNSNDPYYIFNTTYFSIGLSQAF